MLQIKDTRVYGLKESIIASGYAMTTSPYSYDTEADEIRHFDEPSIFSKHLKRAEKLVNASKTTDVHCHDNFLTGITVQFDVKYPQYWSMEAQRYHWFQIITSQSKMHRLLKMDLDKSCNEYVTKEMIDLENELISAYNKIVLEDRDGDWKFQTRNGSIIIAKDKDEALYIMWMFIISNCPMGLELWMRVTTNYKQLQTIYSQRKNHKLKEDWGNFCKWIKTLPHSEFITGEKSGELKSGL